MKKQTNKQQQTKIAAAKLGYVWAVYACITQPWITLVPKGFLNDSFSLKQWLFFVYSPFKAFSYILLKFTKPHLLFLEIGVQQRGCEGVDYYIKD